MKCRKYILLIERKDLGLQNFAPDAGLISFNDARSFVQKRRQLRQEQRLPLEKFYLAEVFEGPLDDAKIEALWQIGSENQFK